MQPEETRTDDALPDFETLRSRREISAEGQDLYESDHVISPDLVYFQGHFPGDPLLPGVVQLNELALVTIERIWPDLGRLEQIRRLKFVQPLRPGDVVTLRLERRATGQVAVQLLKGGTSCTSATLLFAVDSPP